MRSFLFLLMILLFCACSLPIGKKAATLPAGLFGAERSFWTLELKENGQYLYKMRPYFGHMPIEKCDTLSFGRWKLIDPNLIELVSADYLDSLNDLIYEVELGAKGSDDSLYLEVELADDRVDMFYNWNFNYRTELDLQTTKKKIAVLKSKHWRNIEKVSKQTISVNLVQDNNRTYSVFGRIDFGSFSSEVLVRQYNWIKFKFPKFNRCALEFEPLYYDYVRVVHPDTLKWQGKDFIRVGE